MVNFIIVRKGKYPLCDKEHSCHKLQKSIKVTENKCYYKIIFGIPGYKLVWAISYTLRKSLRD